MTAFPERLATLEGLLDDRRSDNGGWPNTLHLDNAPTTIVATSQALEILRIRGFEHRDPVIEGGLGYLAREVQQQSPPKGRGEWTRYPAYALWGLMRYPATLQQPDIWRGAVVSYDWLIRSARRRGGWTQKRRSDPQTPLSLPVTMVAVHALDRFAIYASLKLRQPALQAAAEARAAIMAMAEGRGRQRWWPQAPGEAACPAATCLAVLALARGTEQERQCARNGIAWLAANPQRWTQEVHHDEHIDSRTWRIFSFSLGLRALLHPCAPREVTDPTVAEVVEHFYALWSEDDGGWSDRPGGHATTAGSYAVVSAAHALKRAWPFDPAESLNLTLPTRTSRNGHRPKPPRILFVAEAARRIRVDNQHGETLVEHTLRGSTQWTIVHTLVTRHHDAIARGSRDQTERVVALEELARLLHTEAESVARSIRRLNNRLQQEARRWSRRAFVDLIEDHVPPGTRERSVALEEIEVRLVDGLSEQHLDKAA